MARVIGAAVVFVLSALAGATHMAMANDTLETAMGKALFKRVWVPAPSSTRANDGLGPLFNARACNACHKDLGRAPIVKGEDGRVISEHIVLRLSGADGQADPIYGMQLQTSAIQGHVPEGRLVFRNDQFMTDALAYGPIDSETRTGARVAPTLHGLGLLEQVPDDVLLAMENDDSYADDGVKGRVNRLPNGQIGRFGWKAGNATLADQIELAFLLDLGMSTAGLTRPAGDCTPAQISCHAAHHGGGRGGDGSDAADTPEIKTEIVTMLARYLASVQPFPEAGIYSSTESVAGNNSNAGHALFDAIGCAACHRPALPTATGTIARAYTDLLLHDMGPDLDGGATESGVSATEWRTAPLWGLRHALAAGAGLLHDGRAKTVAEAISWHGGEASSARARFKALSQGDQQRLVDYVGGL